MFKLVLIICLFILQSCNATLLKPNMQSSLPPCPKDQHSYKQNCLGSFKYMGGSEYIGEWKNNKRHGNGIFRSGVLIIPNRQFSYMGEWQNNKRHGEGTMHFGRWQTKGTMHFGRWQTKGKWFQGKPYGDFITKDNFNGREKKFSLEKGSGRWDEFIVQY